MTPYERAIEEQIAYLEAELARYRREQAQRRPIDASDPPIAWALRDPQFQVWLLKRQLANEVHR